MKHPSAYVLDIPAPCDFINANDRGGWHKNARKVKAWRGAAHWAAKGARLPRIDRHVRIEAVIHKTHGRPYDAANWAGTAKAAVDGLRDAGVLIDDTNRYVTGPDMRPGTKSPEGAFLRLVIHVTEEPA